MQSRFPFLVWPSLYLLKHKISGTLAVADKEVALFKIQVASTGIKTLDTGVGVMAVVSSQTQMATALSATPMALATDLVTKEEQVKITLFTTCMASAVISLVAASPVRAGMECRETPWDTTKCETDQGTHEGRTTPWGTRKWDGPNGSFECLQTPWGTTKCGQTQLYRWAANATPQTKQSNPSFYFQ